MNEALDSTLRRVQKLLAIAGDERANPAEASAAAEMAEKIMRKFQIDESDVIERDLRNKKPGAVIRKSVRAFMKRAEKGKGGEHKTVKVPPWGFWLAIPIAKLNDCEVRRGWNVDDGAVIDIFGYEGDVEVSVYMFDYLCNAMVSAVRREQKAGMQKAESESFRRGFILAMSGSLKKLRAGKDAEQETLSKSRALVLVKSAALVEAFGEFSYGTAKSLKVSRSDAFEKGSIEGRKVDVARRGIGTDATAVQKLSA